MGFDSGWGGEESSMKNRRFLTGLSSGCGDSMVLCCACWCCAFLACAQFVQSRRRAFTWRQRVIDVIASYNPPVAAHSLCLTRAIAPAPDCANSCIFYDDRSDFLRLLFMFHASLLCTVVSVFSKVFNAASEAQHSSRPAHTHLPKTTTAAISHFATTSECSSPFRR